MKRHFLVSLISLALGGCALSQSTDKIVLDYNRDFAKARNEVLLLNVLRAAAREPLQFSTMGSVNGQIGNGSSLTIPFTNLIAGGANVISPSLSFSDAVNPTVSINPLASKEFALGILSPMRTETIQLFLHNGWDPEFLLPLIVGGVVCPDGRLLPNSGEFLQRDSDGAWAPSALHLAFKQFFAELAASFSIGSLPAGAQTERTYTLPDDEALAVLKDGMGANYSVTEVRSTVPGHKILVVTPSKQTVVEGFRIGELCGPKFQTGRAGQRLTPEAVASIPGGLQLTETTGGVRQSVPGRIIFRSVGSIIQYLGESHRARYRMGVSDGRGLTYFNRDGTDQILFKIDWGLDSAPDTVSTRFQGTTFRIPAIDLRRGENEDRTLKTLSFLDQLIALQTSESSIRGAQPVVTVN